MDHPVHPFPLSLSLSLSLQVLPGDGEQRAHLAHNGICSRIEGGGRTAYLHTTECQRGKLNKISCTRFSRSNSYTLRNSRMVASIIPIVISVLFSYMSGVNNFAALINRQSILLSRRPNFACFEDDLPMNTLHPREKERRDKEWENRVSAPRGQSRELAGGHHGPAIPRTHWGGRADSRDWGK